jgi:hypothetical protein
MYQHILIDGGYLSNGRRITVLHEDDTNPVVAALKAWWPTGSEEMVQFVSGTSVESAISILVNADHLVATVSTPSLNFGVLGAPRLQRVFIAGYKWLRRIARQLIDHRLLSSQVDVGIDVGSALRSHSSCFSPCREPHRLTG